MSYTKQTWTTGDTITAEKLNHMEDGIGEGAGGIFVVHGTMNEEQRMTLDKTWQQIVDACAAEQLPVALTFMSDDGNGHPYAGFSVIESAWYEDSKYCVMINNSTLQADTPNDYPIMPR